jgi:ABC-type Fe3+/spermidine/putrescine transport system ATPase subunit
MIRVDALTVDFGGFALEDISLRVAPGESFFVLGPSGAGKTLLLEAILGIRPPEKGRIFLDGREVTHQRPERRGVGYVPQDLALFPHLSIRENILFGLHGKIDHHRLKRLDYWVELMDLGSVIDRKGIETLSGGERQRVALARALITEPSVLFMDEPFSALDASLRRRLQIEFRSLQKKLGLTLVQVTHDPEEAFMMADHMAILIDGKIEQQGLPGELYNRPLNSRVASFLMLHNLFDGDVGPLNGEGLREVDLGETTFLVDNDESYPEGSEVLLGIRPEEIILVRPNRESEHAGKPNFSHGEITGLVDMGHYRLVHLRLGRLELDSWLSIRAAREFPMEEGGKVGLYIRPHSFCLLPPE